MKKLVREQLEKKVSTRLEHEKKVRRELIQKHNDIKENKYLEDYCNYVSTLHTY